MTLSSSTKTISGLLLAVTLLLLAMASSAQAAGPAWTLHMAHNPETFERLHNGHGEYTVAYHVTAENSGDAASTGSYTLNDTPPAELTVTNIVAEAGWTCPTTAQVIAGTPLSCTGSAVVAPGASTTAVHVVMKMSPTAPDTVTNEAAISGGGAAAPATATDPMAVVDRTPFGMYDFAVHTTDKLLSDPTAVDYNVAGGHPAQTTNEFLLGHFGVNPSEELKDAAVELPPGFIGNPAALPRCDVAKLAPFFPKCPEASKIGIAAVRFEEQTASEVFPQPIFNVVPEQGYPAEFAFKIAGTLVVLYPTLGPRSKGYPITVMSVDSPRFPRVTGAAITFFGVPSVQNGSPPGGEQIPFLTNPMDCSQPQLNWSGAIDSWQQSGQKLADRTPDLSKPGWKTATTTSPPVEGCDDPKLTEQWDPALNVQPVQEGGAVQADQPAGLAVDVDFPQSNDPTMGPDAEFDLKTPQAPELKDITVKLPAGLSISPSSADGLEGCSDRAEDPAGDQVHLDDTIAVSCPDASKIGTVTATTPLLATYDPVDQHITGAEPINGDVYLVKPHPGDLSQNGDQDGTYRLLIQINSRRNGLIIKLPGTAVADKNTGQLTTTFINNPQQPVKHLQVNLKSGPRAPLATPVTCGKYDSSGLLVPWSTPGTPDATRSAAFSVGAGPNGSPCVTSPQQRPFSPGLSAGTESAKAGAASPFVLKLSRNDGDQELTSLDVTTPKGFTAKLAGVPYCSEAAIASASPKSGFAEQTSPSCPAASQVGTVTTGAGPGSSPYYVQGKAYLAGPYKGAPLSFVFINPAVAGPFDLGNVVVRAAAFVNPETAQVTVKTDAIPQMRDGIPLRIRSITARIDRSNFTLNPTGCEAKSINATVSGANGASASPSNNFQVGECDKLAFTPKLSLSLKGGTQRGKFPALKAVLTQPAGQANNGHVSVALPHSEFLAQEHIRTICTRVQFAADACPAGSIYGFARAYTPLLDQPLEGPVYLRSSDHPLPDLVAALHGQIDVDLVGRIDSIHGGIRNTFEGIPDAPVSRFELEMQGGKKGLLVNSRNLCKSTNKATALFDAQNGRTLELSPVLKNSCKKAKKKGKKAHKGGKSHKRHARR